MPADLDALDPAGMIDRLEPVIETVRRVRAQLPERTALIGFVGAPWTVATYMVEGRSGKDFMRTRRWALAEPDSFGRLIAIIVEASLRFLSGQIEAGAEAVQLFDSWAGVLPEAEFRRWVIEPARAIVARLRRQHPQVPIIGFPRGAGVLHGDYVEATGVDAVSLDTSLPLAWALERLPRQVAVQGNLDPVALVAGGEALRRGVAHVLERCRGRAHVFNLGHGIMPATPVEHVLELARLIRGG
jgi:uroporphyrinogen decarboxylase